MMPIFTMEELTGYDVEQLRNLARYFAVPLDGRMSKGRIIERIYRKLEEMDRADERSNPNSPKMSVRVQRIYDSMKENSR
jgi:hypothetical protein